MDHDELKNRFIYHAPTGNKTEKHEFIRNMLGEAAIKIDNMILNDCREKSLAITALEEAMMWSNAAIARYPDKVEPE